MDAATLQRYEYARDQFNTAIRILAVGRGDVRSRLVDASSAFGPLNSNHLPEELQEDFGSIMDYLTEREPIYDHHGKVRWGSVEVTMRHRQNRTAGRIADRIVSVRDRLDYIVEQAYADLDG